MTDAPSPASEAASPDAGGDDSPDGERISINDAVGKAASLIASDGFGNGDRAALRRISPGQPFTPALWNVLHRCEQSDPPGWFRSDLRGWENEEERRQEWERRWATLLMGLAFCARPQANDPRERSLHRYEVSLGRALFDAGWSETRFVRLLRERGEGLRVELRRVAQYLDSKAQPANWVQVADLLFNEPDDPSPETRALAEKKRLAIARSYYGARHAASQDDAE